MIGLRVEHFTEPSDELNPQGGRGRVDRRFSLGDYFFFFFFYLLGFGVSYLVKQQVTPTCAFTCTRYRNGPPCARGAGLSIAGGAEDASRTAHVRECA